NELAALDVDRQAALIEESIEIADFQDRSKLHKFLERFSTLWEMENASTPDMVTPLFSPSTSGISTDLLISINALKLGGR
ncbi:MAG TPA: flagellar biosynthesis protein FlgF, partial [Pseudorhizobium sp.]|nr:flagellar biosynthesis protein FlgF [Pseudorhizobium sp.]